MNKSFKPISHLGEVYFESKYPDNVGIKYTYCLKCVRIMPKKRFNKKP
jgi:hypothetical protein